MLKYDKLYELVFDDTIEADSLSIITGYIGPALIQDLENLKYNVNIYVGMYGNNVNTNLHQSLVKHNASEKISVFYTKYLVHSKCYIWIKGNRIVRVLIGSANFSTNAMRTPKKEILGDLSPDDVKDIRKYYNLIKKDSYSVEDYAGKQSNNIAVTGEFSYTINVNEVEISLLASKGYAKPNVLGVETKRGDVHASAGLNWGFSTGLSRPNDAYIKIPAKQIRENELLFPPKENRKNEPIDVIWDDGTEMQMLLEGNNTIGENLYPKQISTYRNKSEIGKYLRDRIGKRIGKDLIVPTDSKSELIANAENYRKYHITKQMLEEYGRETITIKLIGERTYYFDFSV